MSAPWSIARDTVARELFETVQHFGRPRTRDVGGMMSRTITIPKPEWNDIDSETREAWAQAADRTVDIARAANNAATLQRSSDFAAFAEEIEPASKVAELGKGIDRSITVSVSSKSPGPSFDIDARIGDVTRTGSSEEPVAAPFVVRVVGPDGASIAGAVVLIGHVDHGGLHDSAALHDPHNVRIECGADGRARAALRQVVGGDVVVGRLAPEVRIVPKHASEGQEWREVETIDLHPSPRSKRYAGVKGDATGGRVRLTLHDLLEPGTYERSDLELVEVTLEVGGESVSTLETMYDKGSVLVNDDDARAFLGIEEP